jgi:ATP-dependent RNA helicase DeaD
VAARGIDLPTLSLVVHVEIPRDAETLQHRSGRTGRAGKKGTAVLIVPYPRRKRVESMLRGARIEAEWIGPPTAEAIRESDRARLLEALLAPAEFDDEDRALAARLMAERSAEDIAAALVRAHRAAMPQAEELIANVAEARPEQRGHRPGFEDVAWFRMDVGRRQNADPRWILPLLCRRGHITRNEIGAIRLGANETHFQVPRAVAGKFAAALTRTAGTEDGGDILIEPSTEAPRETAGRHGRTSNAQQRPTRAVPAPQSTSRGKHAKPRGPRPERAGNKGWPGKGPSKPHRKGPRPE